MYKLFRLPNFPKEVTFLNQHDSSLGRQENAASSKSLEIQK